MEAERVNDVSHLSVVPNKKMPNLYVVATNNGKVPELLDGLFSSRRTANKKIQEYKERHIPQAIVYSGSKKITDEEEAELYRKVVLQTEEDNRGKNQTTEKKNESRAKPVC